MTAGFQVGWTGRDFSTRYSYNISMYPIATLFNSLHGFTDWCFLLSSWFYTPKFYRLIRHTGNSESDPKRSARFHFSSAIIYWTVDQNTVENGRIESSKDMPVGCRRRRQISLDLHVPGISTSRGPFFYHVIAISKPPPPIARLSNPWQIDTQTYS